MLSASRFIEGLQLWHSRSTQIGVYDLANVEVVLAGKFVNGLNDAVTILKTVIVPDHDATSPDEPKRNLGVFYNSMVTVVAIYENEIDGVRFKKGVDFFQGKPMLLDLGSLICETPFAANGRIVALDIKCMNFAFRRRIQGQR